MGRDEALLKPLYGGICSSDLNSYRGNNAYMAYPRVPGHEFSCEIVEIGENDRGFKVGDIVTANPCFNCGKCYSCRRGLVNACMSNQTMGVQREGGFAEYIAMPISRLIDGNGLDAKTLALIEPFCIGYHGIQRAGVKDGDRVLVVGAGTIGVLAAIAAKSRGAKVWICDVAPKKLEYALRFGLEGTVLNDGPEALKKAVDDITDGNGFDVTVECVGLPSTLQSCLDAACFGGRVAVIGVGKHNIDLDFTIIQKKELNIFGSRNALTRDFEELIDIVKTQNLKLDEVVTNIYDFEDAAKAFEDFDRNAGSMLKVMFKF
ncbi:MAG: zinc-binding alcohol dehydrogenase family protein [Clostridia bacterium]|nr:zinc-binding alcohol dehydrogenase family protein [Clostridia bacterium]